MKNMKFYKRTKNQIVDGLQGCVSLLYGFMLGSILVICIFFSFIDFGRKSHSEGYLPPIILMVFGVVFVSGIFALCGKLRLDDSRTRNRLLLVVSAVLLLFQLYSVYNYYFYSDWDVGVLIDCSDVIVHGGSTLRFSEYFSKYSNNLFLASVFSLIRKMAHMIGLHEYEYPIILCVQCMLNTITGLILARMLQDLFDCMQITIVGYVLYLLLVGASPWVSIPYSDSMGLIFPILIVYIYINRGKARHLFWTWLAITMVSFIGFKLKPQILIVFIAISIIEVMETVKNGFSKREIKNVAGAVVGCACALIVSNVAVSNLDVSVDKEMTYGMPHYFMMGMNPDGMGVWSADDVEYTESFVTIEERNAANMKKAMERIKGMGVAGVLKLFARKTLTNYYDGTFCWGGEGEFIVGVLEKRENPWCDFFRGLYYTRAYYAEGKYFSVWGNFEQMLWMTVLLFNLIAGAARRDSNKDVIMLSIIGLTFFELIFEARARYLFTYVPLYIVVAMYGMKYIKDKINAWESRNCARISKEK